jgi:hypothetical protein
MQPRRTAAPKRAKWRPSKTPGRMNATEARYERLVLQPAQARGEVVSWRYEAVKFRLADNTFYTPDFMVLRADGLLELVDVKGSAHWEDDARVKFKVAADLFDAFLWVAAIEGKRGLFAREER